MAGRRKGEKRGGGKDGGALRKKNEVSPLLVHGDRFLFRGFTFLHEFGSPGSGFCPLCPTSVVSNPRVS